MKAVVVLMGMLLSVFFIFVMVLTPRGVEPTPVKEVPLVRGLTVQEWNERNLFDPDIGYSSGRVDIKDKNIDHLLFDPDIGFGEVKRDKVIIKAVSKPEIVDDYDFETDPNPKYSMKNLQKYVKYPEELLFPVPGGRTRIYREECQLCSKLYFRYVSKYEGRVEYGACTNKECNWHSKTLEKIN